MDDSALTTIDDYWSTINHPSGLVAYCANRHQLRESVQNTAKEGVRYGDYMVKVIAGVHYRICVHCTREGRVDNIISQD